MTTQTDSTKRRYRSDDQTVLAISMSKDLAARIKKRAREKGMPASVYLRTLAENDLAPKPVIDGNAIAEALMAIARKTEPATAAGPTPVDPGKALDQIVASAARQAKRRK